MPSAVVAMTGDGDFHLGSQALDAEVDVELEVTGEVPAWLTGSVVRSGPGRWTARRGGQGQRVRHWFDGLALLHRFAVRGGRVHHTDRYLRSRVHDHAVQRGGIGCTESDTVPHRSPLQRLRELRSPPVLGDDANVVRRGDQLVAVTESPEVVPSDAVTLTTGAPLAFTDDVPGVLTTAHPHHDAERGVLVDHTVEHGRRSTHHLYELPDGALARRLVTTVPVDRPSSMHTFAMTDRGVVLVEHPMVADQVSLLLGRCPMDSCAWRPQRRTRSTIIDRTSGQVVARPTTDAFLCWHQVAAAQDGDALILDQLVTPGERAMRQFLLAELLGSGVRSPSGELRRFRVPLDGGPVTQHLVSATPFEPPRALEVLAGARAPRVRRQHARGAHDLPRRPARGGGRGDRYHPHLVLAGLLARGAGTRVRTGRLLGRGGGAVGRPRCPGAPLLLVLDAATFTERARAVVPHVIPHGFHGDWFPEVA